MVAIRLQLSMMVLVPRSREIPRRVSPKTMVSPTKSAEAFCVSLLLFIWHGNSLLSFDGAIVPSCGSSAFALIDFNLLKWRLRFFIHASTLLNLLPNCLRDLHGVCPEWFFGFRDGFLTLANQRSH